MGILCEADQALFASLQAANVLEDIQPHRLEVDGGIILVSCSDGDQFPDVFQHMGTVLTCRGDRARIHTIALNGGPLLLHPNSPLATHGESAVLTAHIMEAARLKSISTVALVAHGPCGKAYGQNLNLAQVVDLLKSGKQHLESQGAGLTVYPFGQIDIPGARGRKRTYHVSGTRWPDWCVTNGYVSIIA